MLTSVVARGHPRYIYNFTTVPAGYAWIMRPVYRIRTDKFERGSVVSLNFISTNPPEDKNITYILVIAAVEHRTATTLSQRSLEYYLVSTKGQS